MSKAIISTPVPKPDLEGGGQWPHLFAAVHEMLTAGGFLVGVYGLVHVDVRRSSAIVVSMEPSSDEEITRLLDRLATADLHPELNREHAALELRRGHEIAIAHPAYAARHKHHDPEETIP